MTEPFDHLDDVDGCKYTLQLSCYAFLLSKYYKKKIRALALCVVHEQNPTYTFVPYLCEEVEYLMRMRREQVAARLRVETDDVEGRLPRCALTGHILYDGVWVESQDAQGNVERRTANRKDAQARYPGRFFPEAKEETQQVRARIDEVTYDTPSPEAADLARRCIPWSERMPMDGVPDMLPIGDL